MVAGEEEDISAYVLEEAEESGMVFSQYNGFNQLVRVDEGNKVYTYSYNGDGLRTDKTVNGV